MRTLKKVVLVMALMSAAALSVLIYWNARFYYRARREAGSVRKIAYLEKSNTICPLNDLAFYELGKAHLDLALENAGDPRLAGSHLGRAISNLERSLKINPYSPYAHFQLGQAILQSETLAPGDGRRPYEEFKKAALLAGEDRQITDQAARFFFSRWGQLGAEDRRFTAELVKSIFAGEDDAKIRVLLGVWEMNIGDPAVIDEVLPRDARVYRAYAGFLGERTLLPEERHKYLAAAERIEFELARKELRSGEYDLFRDRIAQARDHLGRASDLMRGIRFYQVFLPTSLISGADYADLEKAVLLDLAKCRLETGAKLEEVEQDLVRYLDLEDSAKDVAALEAYLRVRGILPEEKGTGLDDLGRTALELRLKFKQSFYREIVAFGRNLGKSLVVVPDDQKADYARVLRTVGDSLQKVDFIYDAVETYRRALEIDPRPLATLVKLRESYQRLNDESRVKEVEAAIRKLEAPEATDLGTVAVAKGGLFSRALTFGGEAVVVDLRLAPEESTLTPVVAVFFNGRVVWEGPPAEGLISLSLDTEPGDNQLQVGPLNRAIDLWSIAWRPDGSPPGRKSPPVRSVN